MTFTSMARTVASAALVAASSAGLIPNLEHNSLTARQNNSTGNLAFAHFMMGVVGDRSSSADYDDDMKRAKAAGIDAFALNIGTDDFTDSQLDYAYESAANNDMSVFISFDFNWFATDDVDSVAQVINTYGGKPAQLYVDEKAFVSTFAGDGLDTAAVQDGTEVPIFWAPNFSPNEGSDLTALDAAFNWIGWDNNGNNKAPDPGNTVTVEDGDDLYLSALSGGDYMAPISPWFFTHFGPEVSYSKNWVFPGDFLWYDRWQQILQLQPRFLEIVTWNDYGESHYIGRLDSPHGDDGNSKWVYGMPHNGWLDMAVPFIAAYHDGSNDVTPYITEDKIVYWYRPIPKDLDCDATDTTMQDADNSTGNYFKGRPDGYETMQDKVFVVTLLTEEGELTMTAGNNSQTVQAPAGAAKFAIDMSAGDVSFSLRGADGEEKLSGTSDKPIANECPCGIYNFNPFVGTLPAGEPDELLPEGYSMIMEGLKVDSCGPN